MTRQPCGTRAAFARHYYHCEIPCGPCVAAERDYQHARHLRRPPRVVAHQLTEDAT